MQSIGCRWKFLKYPLEFCNSKSDLLPPDPWLLCRVLCNELGGMYYKAQIWCSGAWLITVDQAVIWLTTSLVNPITAGNYSWPVECPTCAIMARTDRVGPGTFEYLLLTSSEAVHWFSTLHESRCTVFTEWWWTYLAIQFCGGLHALNSPFTDCSLNLDLVNMIEANVCGSTVQWLEQRWCALFRMQFFLRVQ